MSDLNIRVAEIRSRREHYADIVQEGLRRKIELLHKDAEHAIDYARDAVSAGRALDDEFKELEAFAHSLLLQVALIKSDVGKRNLGKE